MDELIIDEMLSLIMRNQKLLKTPIIFDETHLSVGFNIRRLHDFIQK
jgi:arsenate reductase-like glutaredoxin family protein